MYKTRAKKFMSLDEYIASIKNVIERLHIMFPKINENNSELEVKSILKQLHFILHYAETGESFKAGIIAKNKEVYHELFEFYPVDDYQLQGAISTIYTDLMLNDFNVGQLNQKEGEYLFNIIHQKKIYYESMISSGTGKKNIFNNDIISSILFNKLYWANYTKLWTSRGIKRLQYFFLINLFNYDVQALRAVRDMIHLDAESLCRDIMKIKEFYTGKDAEGTCMDLQPVCEKRN